MKCCHINNKVASFLYTLIRDYIPPGIIEKIVKDIDKFGGDTMFSNEYLAKYAEDVAIRLDCKSKKSNKSKRKRII